MGQTRRGFFGTLAAAVAAHFVPKPGAVPYAFRVPTLAATNGNVTVTEAWSLYIVGGVEAASNFNRAHKIYPTPCIHL